MTPDSRPQAPDSRLQTPDSRPQTPDQKQLSKDTRIIIIIIILIFVAIGYWQILLPWFSEKNYRDGFIANSQGQFIRSMKHLDNCMKLTPWETYYQITQVRNYEEMSRQEKDINKQKEWLEKSRDLYKYMLRINPENPWYWNGIASIYLSLFNVSQSMEERTENFELAGEAYKNASEADTLNPLFQMSYGFYMHRSGKIDEAISYYKRCIELDDWFVEAFYRLAEIELARGKYDEAINYLEGIASADRVNYDVNSKTYTHWVKNGNFNNYRQKLAELYFSHKRDMEKAIEFYKWTLEYNENDASSWKGLGMAYHQDNQLERAIFCYKKSISLDPNQEDVYKYLAYLYYNMGLYNGSIENFNRYFSTNKTDRKAREDFERIKSLSGVQRFR